MEKILLQKRLNILTGSLCLVFAVASHLSCLRVTGPLDILDLHNPTRRKISRHETHSYRVNLQSRRYFRARIIPTGADINVALSGPDGKRVVESIGIENETSFVSTIAVAHGDYRLDVRSLETDAVTGAYEIKVEEVRPAVATDKDRVAAEKAFAEAEFLRTGFTIEASHKAISKYDEARSYWRAVDEKKEEARSLTRSATLHYQLGNPHEALSRYNDSLALSKEAKVSGAQIETLSESSYVYAHLGIFSQALKSCQEAINLSRAICDLRGEALALNGLGDAHLGFGDRWKGLESNQQALRIWWKLNDRRGIARTFWHLGRFQSDLGELQAASDSYDRGLTLSQLTNDKRAQTLILISTATLNIRLGNYQQALDLYNKMLPAVRAAGDRYREAVVLQNTGAVYFLMGEKDKAIAFFDQALKLWQIIKNPSEEAATLSVIGWAHHLMGNDEQAIREIRSVLAVTSAIDDRKYRSNALRDIGSIYRSKGDDEAAIHYYKQALKLHQANGERQGEAQALNEIGALYYDLNQKRAALDYFHRSLVINKSIGSQDEEVKTLYNIAITERDIKQFVKARVHIEEALATAESLRSSVASQNLRASYFASIQQQFDFHIDLLMLQRRQHPRQGYEAEALKISESIRSRSLLEMLLESKVDIRQGANPALVKEEQELRARIETLVERKTKLFEALAPESELASVSSEIEKLIAERDRIEAQIRYQSPRYAALSKAKPSNLGEIQCLLGSDTLLLEYFLGKDRSYVWLVTPSGLKSHTLKSRDEIRKVAERVHQLISLRGTQAGRAKKELEEEYWREASKLSEMILAPAADQLGNKRLLIVADGILQYIPFQALPKPSVVKRKAAGLQEWRPLMLDHEIINLPSASTLVLLRQELSKRAAAPRSIAVIADPVFEPDDARFIKPRDKAAAELAVKRSAAASPAAEQTRDGGFKRLHATIEEANAIKAVTDPRDRLELMGFAATRAAALNAELGQYRIIHFATHGDLDSEQPELSSIVLSLFNQQGQRQEGRLRLHDIYNMNLPAELVVLSACETALGKEIKGEGLVGLTRGFMYAGAARVMASLWKVSDRSTAELMKHFYRFHLKDGMSPAAALRRAQIEMWKQDEWRAPYHWAGFVLQGEYK